MAKQTFPNQLVNTNLDPLDGLTGPWETLDELDLWLKNTRKISAGLAALKKYHTFFVGKNGVYTEYEGNETNSPTVKKFGIDDRSIEAVKIKLGAVGTDELADEAITEDKLTDEVKDKLVVVDNEDIEKTTDGKIRLKDRDTSLSSKGYVVVRQGSLLTQIISEDTIYEIRYNHDLEGSTLDIPTGCVLKFCGGLISNGTIKSNDCEIEASLVKCFNNVNFTGRICDSVFELDWFVAAKNKSAVVSSSTKDSSPEIQYALNCGLRNFHVANKFFYYIPTTITLNHYVRLTGEKNIDITSRKAESAQPCFFTDGDNIVFDVTVVGVPKSGDYEVYYRTMQWNCINIKRFNTSFTIEDRKETIPMINITCPGSTHVWGLYLDVELTSQDKAFSSSIEGESSKYFSGFLGIKISIPENGKGYITETRITGSIRHFYKAITMENNGTSSAWITGTTFGAKTYCVYGGELIGKPVLISEVHQTTMELDTSTSYFDAYFKCNNNCIVDNIIWDQGNSEEWNGKTWKSTSHGISCNRISDRFGYSNPLMNKDNKRCLPIDYLEHDYDELTKPLYNEKSNLFEQIFLGLENAGFEYSETDPELQSYTDVSKLTYFGKFLKAYVINPTTNEEEELDENNCVNYKYLVSSSSCISGTVGELNKYNPLVSYIDKTAAPTSGEDTNLQNYTNYKYSFLVRRYILDVYKPCRIFVSNVENTSVTATVTIEGFSKDDTDNPLFTQTVPLDSVIKYQSGYCTFAPFISSSSNCYWVKFTISGNWTSSASLTSLRVLPSMALICNGTKTMVTASGGQVPNKLDLGYPVLRSFTYGTNRYSGRILFNHSFRTRLFSNTNTYNLIAIDAKYPNGDTIVLTGHVFPRRISTTSAYGDNESLLPEYFTFSIKNDRISINTSKILKFKVFCKKVGYTSNGNGKMQIQVSANTPCTMQIESLYFSSGVKIIGDCVDKNEFKDTTGFIDISERIIQGNGTSDERPKKQTTKSDFTDRQLMLPTMKGFVYRDTTLKEDLVWNGSKWTKPIAYDVDLKTSGTTDERPTLSSTDAGFQYFDTTLSKPIWWTGTQWVDSTGTAV